MAEGRGKARAESLRKARRETLARRLRALGSKDVESVPASALARGDLVEVVAGEDVPADGDVVEGAATVDESAITGESAPVVRESGGDRSAVTGGTRVLSDRIVVKVTSSAGETFVDRMIALVEGAKRKKTPERDRARHPPGGADDRLPVRDGDAAPVLDLRGAGLGPGRARHASPCSRRCSSA